MVGVSDVASAATTANAPTSTTEMGRAAGERFGKR